MKTTFLVAASALMLSTGAAFAAEGGSEPIIYPVNHPSIDGAVAVPPNAQNRSQMAWIEGTSRYAAAPVTTQAPVAAAPSQAANPNG